MEIIPFVAGAIVLFAGTIAVLEMADRSDRARWAAEDMATADEFYDGEGLTVDDLFIWAFVNEPDCK